MLAAAAPTVQRIDGNPIVADGSYYSADPAPVVDGDTLYVMAGRDEAAADVNDFVMNEWQLFSTEDVGGRRWMHRPGFLRPEEVFAWAATGRAYASQIVKGRNGRFYLYAPVMEAASMSADKFGIGVAVADRPTGPWRDAHPAGPIASQTRPEANGIQNIDPTVLVDDDGRAYLYWGTFGKLRGVALAADMVTPIGPVVKVESLTGFFEAPWIMKRAGTYYMLYAGNNVGASPACTPTLYHACIAYGTAASPLGPWTYRGTILDPVSSTTSHPGAVLFRGQWYLAYHTADAAGGGPFRRSIAIDRMEWDDSVSPAAIRKVLPTRRPVPPRGARRNIAPAATATASNEPLAIKYWTRALNDEIARPNPLPPEMWATGPRDRGAQTLQYSWSRPVTLNGARVLFFADREPRPKAIAPPQSWHAEYWNAGQWAPVPGVGSYGTRAGTFEEVRFRSITTRCVRLVLAPSVSAPGPASMAVQEWEVLSPSPVRIDAVPAGSAPCERG